MSNTLLTIGMITQEALMVLENSLTFTRKVNRQYDDQFAVKGAKIGDTINIRRPVRYVGRRTAALSVENTTETSVPLTLSTQYGCDMSFTSAELSLSLDDFSSRIIKPAVATMSNMIDYDGLQQYLNIYQAVGTPGTTGTDLTNALNAGVKLDNSAAPDDKMRSIVLNPQGQASVVGGLTTLFNPNRAISDQYIEGEMGRAVGFDWYMDQNVATQTIGTYAATNGSAVTASATVTSGSTIATTGWTSGDTLNVGDIFTIAGCYAVNPQSRVTTGQLQQFVITATPTPAGGGGTISFTVSPAIVTSGQYQNVTSAGVVSGQILTVYGASAKVTPQNVAFHRDAFTFGTTDLPVPGGVDMGKRVTSKQLGMSMRLVRAYDINNDRFPCRLDLLGGWATLRPELACRISG